MNLKRYVIVVLSIMLSVCLFSGAISEGSVNLPSLRDASYEELEEARQKIRKEIRSRIHAKIVLSESDVTLAVGSSLQLKAEIHDLLEDLSFESFVWSSADENIASVNRNGQIRALFPGKTDIICSSILSDGTELRSACKITIYVPVARIEVANRSLSIIKGQSEQIVPIIKPENATNPSIKYVSSDEEIATVSGDGLVKAVSVGSFEITLTATDGSGKFLRLSGKVLQDVEKIDLDQTKISLPIGNKVSIKPVVQPATAANKKVIFSSDDESIASVNEAGQITGNAKGTTAIRIQAADGNRASAICNVTVVDPVTSVTLSEKKLNLVATVSMQLDADVQPETATNRMLHWSSSNEAVAEVNQAGVINPKANGRCIITAETTDGSGVKAQVNVTVKEYDVVFTNAEGITLNYDSFNMNSGMFTMSWGSKNKRVNISGDHGSIHLVPIAEGEDVVSVTEREYFSRKKISKKWTVYVMPGALTKTEEKE